MLSPGIVQFHSSRRQPDPASVGIAVGRGVPASSYKSPYEDAYAKHLQQLEDVRLVGYRYLKPPGVTKTLRTIHEDEAYAAGATTERSVDSETASEASDAGDAAADITQQPARSEDNSMLVDDEESGDDAPDFSLPALNASFPSLYYQS